jgi:hypothetical protein
LYRSNWYVSHPKTVKLSYEYILNSSKHSQQFMYNSNILGKDNIIYSHVYWYFANTGALRVPSTLPINYYWPTKPSVNTENTTPPTVYED